MKCSVQGECRICDFAGMHDSHIIREMMFGTREYFRYIHCPNCGCLQIKDVPLDLSRHYPPNYYAQGASADMPVKERATAAQRWINRQVVRPAIFQSGYRISSLLRSGRALPQPFFRARPEIINRARLSGFRARILDVGCGEAAEWLNDLREVGFTALWGVDPYLKSDGETDGIHLVKDDLCAFAERARGTFELIAFNHSLEHILDQRQVLAAAGNLLTPGGTCVVRIPMLPCLAWEVYGVDWVELDAPRHLYIHSRRSIELVAQQAGLTLRHVSFDTSGFELFGSEQYKLDIPLTDPRSAWMGSGSAIFSMEQLEEFDRRAGEANRDGTAGRAVLEFSKL